MRALIRKINSYSELCKVMISLFSAISSAIGFMLASSEPKPQITILAIGAFCLACGSSALNQYQERAIDALMERTKKRPLPSGEIEPFPALVFSLMLLFLGSSTLLFTGSLAAPLLGLFAVFWYNGVYTPLKKRTAFAIIPGALVGAVPPAIGWVAGGGDLGDPRILALCFFFFIWQVPHFWLLILDYAEEYEQAGLPCLTVIFSKTQLMRITFSWILATAVSCLFITVHRVIRFPLISLLLLAASFWLIGNGIILLRKRASDSFYSFAFKRTNIYLFLVMILLSADRVFMQVTQ